jgi:hypothetical protein
MDARDEPGHDGFCNGKVGCERVASYLRKLGSQSDRLGT